jgi:hypothetical protein
MFYMFRILLKIGKTVNPYVSFEHLYEFANLSDDDLLKILNDRQKDPILAKNLD